jgi:hypothetical protein
MAARGLSLYLVFFDQNKKPKKICHGNVIMDRWGAFGGSMSAYDDSEGEMPITKGKFSAQLGTAKFNFQCGGIEHVAELYSLSEPLSEEGRASFGLSGDYWPAEGAQKEKNFVFGCFR